MKMDYRQENAKMNTLAAGVMGIASNNMETCAPPSVPGIAMQMNHLNNSLDLMEKSLVNLQSRLSPILTANRPAKPQCDQESMQSDLAKLLQVYNNRLGTLIDLVNEINGRVEL